MSLTAKLISAFVFATQTVQFFFLNLKFQACSHPICAYTVGFVSDLLGNHIVGFLTTGLILQNRDFYEAY